MIPTTPDGWISGSKVQIDMNLTGDNVLFDKRNRLKAKVLGGRAAGERSTSILLHEFGHFIETEERRFLKDGYGLKVREVPVCGQLCYEPETAQITLREIRVMGIQAVLGDHFGCPYNIRKDLAVLAKWFDDWSPARAHFGLYDLSVKQVEHDAREELYYNRVADAIKVEKEKHSVAELFNEFRRRCLIHDATVGRRAP